MGHDPFVLRDRFKQRVVDFDGIDRRQAQTFELGHMIEDLLDQPAEIGASRQIPAIGGKIDAGQHDFF